MVFYKIEGEVIYSKLHRSFKVPSFLLDASEHNISNEYHVISIAERIVEPTDNPDIEVNLRAIKIEK